jgi:hypothetical protein
VPKRVFISYRSTQAEWVRTTLYPVLSAGGAQVTVDYEQFRLAQPVRKEMERAQKNADVHLLVLTPDYLDSDYCREEMKRAIASDPDFAHGKVVPVIREKCDVPPPLKKAGVLYADLSGANDRMPEPWDKVMKACGADLGAEVPHWLDVFRRTVRALQDERSVNLRVTGQPRWRELMDQVKLALPQLGIVDMDAGKTARLEGLVATILAEVAAYNSPIKKNETLAVFERVLEARDHSWLALKHFDQARDRKYGNDFFSSLRFLITEKKRLTLLVESRAAFASCLPVNHALSFLELETVELRSA